MLNGVPEFDGKTLNLHVRNSVSPVKTELPISCSRDLISNEPMANGTTRKQFIRVIRCWSQPMYPRRTEGAGFGGLRRITCICTQ